MAPPPPTSFPSWEGLGVGFSWAGMAGRYGASFPSWEGLGVGSSSKAAFWAGMAPPYEFVVEIPIQPAMN